MLLIPLLLMRNCCPSPLLPNCQCPRLSFPSPPGSDVAHFENHCSISSKRIYRLLAAAIVPSVRNTMSPGSVKTHCKSCHAKKRIMLYGQQRAEADKKELTNSSTLFGTRRCSV
ncbi:hypothetical protein M513_04674 [Trichuris suis]|uniref:Uncharacterized protein n=1 Tax=Trichuris suis TaxID=68888 RepID=A0A085MBD1_9BILA|nr:hypothetical protein M513_04674 [Trichuris suis]